MTERIGTWLRRLPKAELHVHLEASMRPATAAELADRYGLPLPRSGPFRDLGEFVVAYEAARDLVGSLDDLRRLGSELIEDAARDGVVWTEVHLIPPTYAGRLGPDEAVLEAALDGISSATTGAASGAVILGINRGLGLAGAERSLHLARRYRYDGVVGLGLAGDEANHPAARYRDVFRRAAADGLAAVPHAGEGAGAGSVRDCIELLGARRINHGVRAVEDPQVLDLVVERGVCLDVCPASNVSLRVVPSYEQHPLRHLIEAGVAVTLNSDGVLFSAARALDEYRAAHDRLGLTRTDLRAIARNSLIYSSCPDGRRAAALATLDAPPSS